MTEEPVYVPSVPAFVMLFSSANETILSVKTDLIVKHLNSILARYRKAVGSKGSDSLSIARTNEFLASGFAAVNRYAPPDSPYLSVAKLAETANDSRAIQMLMGVVEALREDYRAGGLAPIQELIRAEVFDDFLDMAGHLIEQGYKDPAAVVIGSVLEEHLRKLCDRAGIPTVVSDRPKKADMLNSELAAKNVYGKLDLKSVTSWLDLRNKAAHGHYDQYGVEQVKILMMGVRDFIGRVRAT